jgi:hypothetical protein
MQELVLLRTVTLQDHTIYGNSSRANFKHCDDRNAGTGDGEKSERFGLGYMTRKLQEV